MLASSSSSSPYEVVLKNELDQWARRVAAENRTSSRPASSNLDSQQHEPFPSSTNIPPALIVLLHVHRHFCTASLEFLGLVKETFSQLSQDNPVMLESLAFVLCRLFTYWCETPAERSDLVSNDGRPRPTLRGMIVFIEKLEKQWPKVPRIRKLITELKLTILRATTTNRSGNRKQPSPPTDELVMIPRSQSSGFQAAAKRDLQSSLHLSQPLSSLDKNSNSLASVPSVGPIQQTAFQLHFVNPPTFVIATALTHIEFQRFRRINCTELLNHTKRISIASKLRERGKQKDDGNDKESSDQSASSQRNQETAKHSNIAHMIKRTNGFVIWLASRILSPTLHNDDRVSLLQRCIQLATDFVELRNYSSAMAMLSLLNMRQISRLRKVVDVLPPKYRTLWQQLDDLFDARGNFNQYRTTVAAHAAKGEFVLPFLGVFLRDCTFIDEVHQWRIETGPQKEVLFNAEKLSLMMGLVNQFSQMQQKHFQPTIIPTKSYAEMSHFFRSAEIQLTACLITDEKLDELSYAIEPLKLALPV